jgi:hypothetical protein
VVAKCPNRVAIAHRARKGSAKAVRYRWAECLECGNDNISVIHRPRMMAVFDAFFMKLRRIVDASVDDSDQFTRSGDRPIGKPRLQGETQKTGAESPCFHIWRGVWHGSQRPASKDFVGRCRTTKEDDHRASISSIRWARRVAMPGVACTPPAHPAGRRRQRDHYSPPTRARSTGPRLSS